MNIEEKLSRGFELLQEKDIDHSLDIAREVQKEAPDTPEGYYLEALIMQQLNQMDISFSCIEKAIDRSDNNGVYLNLRGHIHMMKEDLEKAEVDFDGTYLAAQLHRNYEPMFVETKTLQADLPLLLGWYAEDVSFYSYILYIKFIK